MATGSVLTLRNMQLKVVGCELIQPLLELRGSGWFCFWLWCLIGRRKTISGFVLEDAVEAWRRTSHCSEDSKTVYLPQPVYLTPVLNKARQEVTPPGTLGTLALGPPYWLEPWGSCLHPKLNQANKPREVCTPWKPCPLPGPDLRVPTGFKVNFQ